jgi:hypothetical protein
MSAVSVSSTLRPPCLGDLGDAAMLLAVFCAVVQPHRPAVGPCRRGTSEVAA